MDASMAQKIVFYQMVGHHPAGSVGGRLWPPKAPRKRQLWRWRLIPLTQVRLYVVGVARRFGPRFFEDCLV
jgi:hypothetical protein